MSNTKGKNQSFYPTYPDLDEESVLLFWKQNAGLKDIEFIKVVLY